MLSRIESSRREAAVEHRRRPPHARRRRCRRGFTIIEAISTIVILAAIGSVASTVIFSATDGYVDASTSAQLHAELSAAMDRAVREVRRIPLDPAASGLAPDVDFADTSLLIWNTSGPSFLSLTGSSLRLRVDGGGVFDLLEDVTAFDVKTYDESGTLLGKPISTTGCDPIRRVELTITIERYGVSETLRSRVFLRSMMSGAA